MKWLKRRLRNWVNNEGSSDIHVPIAIRGREEPDSECIRFKVFKANGGTVIQTETYDRKTDRHNNALHVIVEGQDVGAELGKIITLHYLKK